MFVKSEIPANESESYHASNYPFKDMAVGDCVETSQGTFKAQKYAHNYASATGKKFKTRKIDGVMKIWRVS